MLSYKMTQKNDSQMMCLKLLAHHFGFPFSFQNLFLQDDLSPQSRLTPANKQLWSLVWKYFKVLNTLSIMSSYPYPYWLKNQISFTFSKPQDQYQRIFSLFWPLSTPWSDFRRRYVTELKTDINGFVTFTPNGSLLKSWYCRCSSDLLGAPQNITPFRMSPAFLLLTRRYGSL